MACITEVYHEGLHYQGMPLMACITEVYHEELALLRYDIEGLHY